MNYKALKTVINPVLWFWARGKRPCRRKIFARFFRLIDKTKTPFLAILNQEGL